MSTRADGPSWSSTIGQLVLVLSGTTSSRPRRSSDRGGLPIWADMNKVRGQARRARRGAAIVLLALLVPQGTLLLLRTQPRLDVVLRSVTAHLVVVSAISACALAVAVAAAVAAGRSRDGSLVLLALSCLAVGFLMLGHGLTTPGIAGRPPNLWVGRLPVLAIAGFAAGLCAAAWPQRWPARWAGRRPRGTLAAGAALLGVVPGAAVLWPAAGGGLQPLPGEAWVRLGLIVAAAAVLIAVGTVHWWRWRLGFDRVQLALVVACLLGAGALVSLQVGALWRLSWWDYHAFLLTGFAAAIYAVLDGVFASDPMAHISRGYSETLRALIGAVEARDALHPRPFGPGGRAGGPPRPAPRAGARHPAQPGRGRLPARRRQGQDPRSRPEQAGSPDRGGAGLDRAAPGGRLRHRRAGPLTARRPGGHPPAPRALRRQRLSRRPRRGADLPGRPDRRRGRRVGRAHL
jgi:hypothetical protein